MGARSSNRFFVCLSAMALLFCLMLVHARHRRGADSARIRANKEMVRVLGLTDMCLFTDARYTRHPSLADLNTPFMDFPMSFEHFPSGSLIMPPPHLDLHALD